METPPDPIPADVPKCVFEEFLRELPNQGVPEEVVHRLRKLLLEERKVSERTLQLAIYPEEPAP